MVPLLTGAASGPWRPSHAGAGTLHATSFPRPQRARGGGGAGIGFTNFQRLELEQMTEGQQHRHGLNNFDWCLWASEELKAWGVRIGSGSVPAPAWEGAALVSGRMPTTRRWISLANGAPSPSSSLRQHNNDRDPSGRPCPPQRTGATHRTDEGPGAHRPPGGGGQGCIRREGTSEAAPKAVRRLGPKRLGAVTVGYKCH